MNKILINFAHPAKARSNVNKALRKAVEGLENVTINDLYANYPDFMIDVKKEQDLCETHDVIIFQHPFYWYSTPAIMKEWLDLVLEHGWAYGSSGKALHGKVFFQALSAGGEADTYKKDGYNKFTINELTSPYQATANLCGMKWLPPFAVTGIHDSCPNEKIKQHAEDFRRTVIAFRDSLFDIDAVKKMEFLNSDLNKVILRA